MLDVEFLLNRPRIDRHLVYKYRTGLLKRDVQKEYEANADKDRAILVSIAPETAATQLCSNIFSDLDRTYTICIVQRSARISDNDVHAIMSSLLEQTTNRIAVFLPVSCALTRHASWAQVENATLVIEEPEITSRTLAPVLRYLEETSKLVRQPGLSRQPAFVSSFASVLAEGADFGELTTAFLMRVVTMTDAATGAFDARRHRLSEIPQHGCMSPLILVRRLTTDRDSQDLVTLITVLDERLRSGWTATAVVVDLHRIAARLLPSNTVREQPGRGEPGRQYAGSTESEAGRLLWCIVFLAWENRLLSAAQSITTGERRTPSIFIPALDQMGRDFLGRSQLDRRDGALDGLWPDLQSAMASLDGHERTSLQAARIKSARHLADALAFTAPEDGQPWRERLGRALTQALARVDSEVAQLETHDPPDVGADVNDEQEFQDVLAAAAKKLGLAQS